MKKEIKPKLLVILGPTAVGKSGIAVRLAKKFNGEIISADSRQVYKGLNVGTGKITRREMKGVRHHLLDVANPKQRFNAEKFKRLADLAITDIILRNKLPILCGGTGFYIDAVVGEIPLPPIGADNKLRIKLAHKSPVQLLNILKKLNPVRASKMAANNSERNNIRRLIRAIEVAIVAEVPPLEMAPRYEVIQIGLQLPKTELRMNIHDRLIKRLNSGMIAEAKHLHARGLSWKRMDELGLEYRYLALHIQGKMTKDEMVSKLETEIWRYAKRQMTWFRKNKKIKWFNPEEFDQISEYAST
jgi:tRNA dimethylallyltransferase